MPQHFQSSLKVAGYIRFAKAGCCHHFPYTPPLLSRHSLPSCYRPNLRVDLSAHIMRMLIRAFLHFMVCISSLPLIAINVPNAHIKSNTEHREIGHLKTVYNRDN
jgi:hypothetical protein